MDDALATAAPMAIPQTCPVEKAAMATKIICTHDDRVEPVTQPKCHVLRKSCLTLAEKLARGGKRCIILAPANNRAPGGPDCEEMLSRTNLLETLAAELYPIDSAELSGASLLYSKAVTVFKDTSGQVMASPFEIGVISCAAVAHASTKRRDGGGKAFRHPRDASIIEAKMCGILGAAVGADALIINASWGLGPLEGVVDLWRKAFSSTKAPPHVVFAIAPRDGDVENADIEAKAYGFLVT
jgi:uncharacterized protein (TIGR02452 family)